ncbi:MAG: YeeE/YedE thiosulfate transporter family protein [Proteobacteria bacterium]|nr:YeeE/YedE thiosulfate transporter family protein [Pseudomonadota bacterium]
MNIINFTPIESLLGGLIIGLAVAILYLMRGNYTGISGIYYNVISVNKSGFLWRFLFITGLIIGPVLLSFFSYTDLGFEMPNTNPIIVILGGLLVGYGTQLGSGCTSGHGVCGIGRLSIRSIVGTCVFVGAGVVTVLITRSLGWVAL